jgi:glycosyltransferase involved in cell wall biosynthesis
MTAAPATSPVTTAFVLVTYRHDEPAGMERATAALVAGLRSLGHRAIIISAVPQARSEPGIITLSCIPAAFPCDDTALRGAIEANRRSITGEVAVTLARHHADLVVYVDALWGLGSIAGQVPHPARRVLAVHVVGGHTDLDPALAAAGQVITPSRYVLAEAGIAGYDVSRWRVVPNPLLYDPEPAILPGSRRREQLRTDGPVRVVARLGAEKGIAELLAAMPAGDRPVQVALASAGFETMPGSQKALLARCHALARAAGADLRPALAWQEVSGFLAGSAVTIIPSVRETFGNLALESLAAGTPVVAYATGNLPALIGEAGTLIPLPAGPGALWYAAHDLLSDPVRYHQACGDAYCRSRNYRSTDVADAFLKAVLR